MSPERRDRAIRVMQEIQSDVEVDVHRREGQAFTGVNVAAALGEMCAQIGAIALGVELLLRDHEGAQR